MENNLKSSENNNLQYKISKEHENIKVREYMLDVAELSGRFTKKASMERRIRVNGKSERPGCILKEGDILEIVINKEEHQDIAPEDLNIKVVYEDDDLLVVNKEPFMVVHPTKTHPTGTLANGIIYHFRSNNDMSIVRLVSRLDRDTSGLIMVAKNQFAHMSLAKAMEENKVVKAYYAVVHGVVSPEEGTIDKPIGRPSEDSLRRTVCSEEQGGQRSITHYKVINQYNKGALLEVVLETGRTHQIRVHLSSMGYPLYGDELYGEENYAEDKKIISRQALHAYKLIIPHPRTGEEISIESQLPEDIKILIENLK